MQPCPSCKTRSFSLWHRPSPAGPDGAPCPDCGTRVRFKRYALYPLAWALAMLPVTLTSWGIEKDKRMVKRIFVAEARGRPMKSVSSVDAITGQGLAGDRYCRESIRRGPDYQVSLIEAEAIDEFTKQLGLRMTEDMPRRNVVTTGVRLNEFLGKRFFVGPVLLEGLELCEPCGLFAKRTYPQVVSFFKGRGGLRARIVEGGTIRTGDRVCVAPGE